jgi:hypothetical protein
MNLNIDLKNTDTTMPKLEDGDFLFQIAQTEVAPSKQDPDNRNLVVTFSLAQDARSKKGEKLSQGYKIRKYLPLQQSKKENAPDFARDIAVLYDCAFNLKNPEDRPVIKTYDDFKLLHGRPIKLRIGTETTEEYGEQNVIKRMLPTEE